MIRTKLFLAGLFVGGLAVLWGQTSGEITGHVSDPSGAAIPGATLTLTNVATNAVRTTQSTPSGDYTFPLVPPGLYNVRAEHAGFKAATSNNIHVQVQQTIRLDLTLQIGEVSATIEVSASADLLQTENATVGTVVGNQSVTELPLNGRNYLSLVALSANANTHSPISGQAAGRLGGDRAGESISAGGNRIMFDYYTLDGVSNTDPDFVTYVVLPSIDAIQEFKVQTGIYPAEFGHEATQINVVTKSGGNSYHGALFEFLRNDELDAKPYSFTSAHVAKSPFKWNDYGFEVDGPVRIPKVFNGKDRLFFMANDEWKAQRQNSQGIYSVPTAAMFTGDMSVLGVPIYDPNTAANGTKTAFPGNQIPASRLDPISQRFLKYYVPSNLPGLARNYSQINSSPNNRDGFTLRMDFVESANSQWTGRYSWGDENQSSTGLSIVGSKILTNYEQYLGTNTRTFSPYLVNEARFGYSRLFNSLGTRTAYDVDTVSALNIPGLKAGDPSSWGVPMASFSGDGFAAIGDVQDGPYVIRDNTLQLVDNLSWIRGKHMFRFGIEYNRQNFDQIGNQFSRGQFAFQPNATALNGKGGDAFAEFLLGDIWQSTVAAQIASASLQRNAWAAFAEDNWKITSKLTAQLGLRYELTPPWTDLDGKLFTVHIPHLDFVQNAPEADWPFFVRQGNCTDAYEGINVRWTKTKAVCSNGLLTNQLMKTSYKDFAPRLSFAYSPDGKTVIRTGFGMFYNQDIGNAYFDLARNLGARVTTYSDAGTPTLFYSNSIPGGSSAVAQIPPPYAFSMSYDHHTTYNMQYLFDIQRQMGGNWVLEAGYLGSQSRHLQGFQNANMGFPGTTGSPYSRIPFPNFGVIQLVADGANGNYNAFSFKATRRFSKGLNVISSYTWAKSLDETSGIRVQGSDTLFPANSNCIRCERGLSAFDVHHRLVTSVLYELPVGKGKALDIANPVLNTVIGGWQTGGIFTAQSGTPGTLSIGVDNSGALYAYDRPVYTGISPYLSNPTPSRWWNLASFVEAPPGQFGNVGRNTIIGPRLVTFDFEVHKNFPLPYKEGHQLQFRLEAFNALNHPSWGMPNLNILSGKVQTGMTSRDAHTNFGVITSTAAAMRQVQLGLKYIF